MYITYQIVLIILISLLLAKINALITAHVSAALIVKYSAILSKIIVTPDHHDAKLLRHAFCDRKSYES